jgi:hypothetical protein
MSNYVEFLTGTNPMLAASALKLTIEDAGFGARVRFPSLTGATARLQFSYDLASGQWVNYLGLVTQESNGLLSILDQGATNQTYYRLELHP